MNTNKIFLGNIMCDQNLVDTNVVLLKCKYDVYVELKYINSASDVRRINTNQSTLMRYKTLKNGYYYVDRASLKPYYERPKQKSLRKIKYDAGLSAK